jgi:transcriptional regulator with XRE-family HTH domain
MEQSKNNIKKYRLENKINQREFAKRMGVTTSYIWQVEQGYKNGSIKLLERMAKELGVTVEQLRGNE